MIEEKQPKPPTGNVFVDRFNRLISGSEGDQTQPTDQESPDIVFSQSISDSEIDDALSGLEEVPTGAEILNEVERKNSGRVPIKVRNKFFDAARGDLRDPSGQDLDASTVITSDQHSEDPKTDKPSLDAEVDGQYF